VSENIIT